LCFFAAVLWPSLIDYLWALRGDRHQCVHDKWTGTIALDIRSGRPEPDQRDMDDGALEGLLAYDPGATRGAEIPILTPEQMPP
jgi:hypothetical protein